MGGNTAGGKPSKFASIGELKWNRATQQLALRGEIVKVSWRAAAVFGVLAEARGEPVTREELQRRVWGDVQMDYSVLSQAILSLRRALDPAPGGESYIETVARSGYRLAVEVVDDVEAESPTPAAAKPAPANRAKRMVAVALIVGLLVASGAAVFFAYQQTAKRRQADLLVEKAFQLLRRGTGDSGSQAGLLFREALAVIPNYAPAKAGIAESAARMGQFQFDHALAQARQAAAADPDCSECQSILGYVLGVRMWRWKEAQPFLERAIQLNGRRASHRLYFGEWLATQGRLEEASRQVEEATRLEPENPWVWSMLASIRYFQRRYEEAIREADKAASLDTYHPSGFVWAYHSYMMLGDDRMAAAGRAKSIAAFSTDFARLSEQWTVRFEQARATGGRTGLVKYWLEEVGTGRAKQVHRYNRALWSMWAGDAEGAIAELEAGLESRPYQMIFVARDPIFEPLRGNPRFQEVVRRVGLQ